MPPPSSYTRTQKSHPYRPHHPSFFSSRGGGSYLSLRDLSMVSFGILMGMASISIFKTLTTVPLLEAGPPPHDPHPLSFTTSDTTKGHHVREPGSGGLWRAQRPTFILFGDSLTQRGYEPENSGWVSHLSNAYSRRVDVLNRGFSGWNSRWCRLVMEDLFPLSEPQWESPLLVVVFLGANDAALPDRTQHATLVEYTGNLNAIIDHFRSRDSHVSIILFTPPPVDEIKWGQHCKEKGRDLDRVNSITRQYAQACIQVGKEQGVTVVDLWTALGGNDPKAHALNLNDGLHFSASGNRLVYEALMQALERDQPHLLPHALPSQGPDHWLIDRFPQRLDVGLSTSA